MLGHTALAPLSANRNLINIEAGANRQDAAPHKNAAGTRKSVATAITASPVAQHITQRRAAARRAAVREALTPVAPPSPAKVDSAPVLADLRLLAPITLASEGGAEGIHLALRVGGGGDGSEVYARSAAQATKLMVDLSRTFSRVYSSWDEFAMLSHVVSPLVDALFMDTGRGAAIVCQGGVAPPGEEATTMWGDAFAPKLTAMQAAEQQGDKENPVASGSSVSSCGSPRRGVVKHVLELLFAHISAANSSELSGYSWALGVSAVDITPADLLVDCFAPHAAAQPKLLESWSGELTMTHATRKLVHSASHGLRLIGSMLTNNAKDAQTQWNHRLLTFTLERKSKAEGTVASTNLQLFDLAQAQPEPVPAEPAVPSSSSSSSSSTLPPISAMVRRLVNPSLIALDKVVVRLAQLNRAMASSAAAAQSSGRRRASGAEQSPASSRSPSPSVSPSPTQSPSQQHPQLKSAAHIAWREGLLTRLLKSSLGNSECRSHCAWLLGFNAQESGSADLVARMKFAQKLAKISNTMTSPAEDAANAAAAAAAAAIEGHHQPSTNLTGHMSLHDETLQEILFRQAQLNDPLAAGAAGPSATAGSRTGTPRQSGVHARLSATPSRRASMVAELNVVGTGIKTRRKLFEAEPAATAVAAVDPSASPASARKQNRVSFRDHDDASSAAIIPPPPQSSPMATSKAAAGAAPASSTRRWKFTASKTASTTRAVSHTTEEPELPTELARALGIKPSVASSSAKIASAPLTSPATSPAPWPPAHSVSRRRWVVKPNASATVDEQRKTGTAFISLQAAHALLEQRLVDALATVQALTQKAQESERQLQQFRQAPSSSDTSALSNTCDSLRSELASVESQLDSLCGGSGGCGGDAEADAEIGMHSIDSLEDMDENFIRSSLDTPRNGGYGGAEEHDEEEWRDATDVIPLSMTMDRPLKRSPASNASSAAKDGESRAARIYSKALKLLSKEGLDLRRISINDSLSSADTSTASAHATEASGSFATPSLAGALSPGPISPPPTCSSFSTSVSRRASLFCAESPVATRLNALIRSSMSIQSFALHCSAGASAQATPQALAMSPQQLRTWKVAKRAPAPNLVLPSVARAAAAAAAAAAANNAQALPAASPEKKAQSTVAPHTPVASDPLEAEAQRLAASGLRIRTNRKLQQQAAADEASQTAAGCSIQ